MPMARSSLRGKMRRVHSSGEAECALGRFPSSRESRLPHQRVFGAANKNPSQLAGQRLSHFLSVQGSQNEPDMSVSPYFTEIDPGTWRIDGFGTGVAFDRSRPDTPSDILAEEPTLVRGFDLLTILALTLANCGGLAPESATGQECTKSEIGLKRTPRVTCSSVNSKAPAGASEIRFQPLGLSPVRPYVADKVPVVLVHGLWGSPRNWARMVSALEADPFVGDRFQFFTFGYSGGSPITYSAYLLRRELRTLRDSLDPDHTNPAWDRTVLIGHSMGGLLCKMTTQESGSKLWDLMAERPFEELVGPTDARELLRWELVYKPVAEVRRLIFVATPHRGSRLVCGAVKDIGSRLVPAPARLRQAHAALVAWNGLNAFTPTFRAGLSTSLDQLAWEHPLLLAIDSLPIDFNVKRHSIIADQRRPLGPTGGDGLVSYASAHLVGATSELLVNAGHLCLDKPEVISEVARILNEHATQ
jgi:pimeloyl-ACP methyl ester carboxylesterase